MSAFQWLGFAIAACLHSLYKWHAHLNTRVRRRVLGDLTSVWGGGVFSVLHSVSFLRLGAQQAGRDGAALSGAVRAAIEAAHRHGGSVCYVGYAEAVLYHCAPLTDGAGFDVVVLCGWPGDDGDAAVRRVAAWRAELAIAGGGGWQRDVSQGFWRNALANLLLGVVATSALLLKTVLLRQSHSCVQPFAHESTAAERSALRAEKAALLAAGGQDASAPSKASMAMLADDIEQAAGGKAGDGVMVFNLINASESPLGDKLQDLRYNIRMLEMTRRHGGAPMHVGSAQGLGDDSADGVWQLHAAMHYPGRDFFARVVRSQWMHSTVQGKKPGKAIAVATTPFFPTAESAICLQDY